MSDVNTTLEASALANRWLSIRNQGASRIGVAVLLSCITFVGVCGGLAACGPQEPVQPDYPSLKIDRDDEARVNEIIQQTMIDPNYLTPSVHKEFWRLLRKGEPTDEEIREFREFVTSVGTTYQMYFWEDARASVMSGKPYRSPDRVAYEEYLLSIGALTHSEIERNDDILEKIAAGKPIDVQGQEVRLGIREIDITLENIEEVLGRVERLFTPQDD